LAALPAPLAEQFNSIMVITSSSKAGGIKRPDAREPDSRRPEGGILDEFHAAPAVRVNVAEHPVAQHALTALRNKHTPPKQFRQFSNQLLVFLTIEATRTLPTREEMIETAEDSHAGRVLETPVIFLSLARHGLGLAHAIAEFIPGVSIGTIGLERAGHDQRLEPRLHLVHAPALNSARVILFDPIVGTGHSASVALHLLRCSGASDVSLLSFLISAPGLKRVQATVPDLTVWTAAIERDLDPKRGLLPGLGNFAERLYA
jgi:uracil phosphoribosyltransferase